MPPTLLIHQHQDNSFNEIDQNVGPNTDLSSSVNDVSIETYTVVGTDLLPFNEEENTAKANVQKSFSDHQFEYYNPHQISVEEVRKFPEENAKRNIFDVEPSCSFTCSKPPQYDINISSSIAGDMSSDDEYVPHENASTSEESHDDSYPEKTLSEANRKRQRKMPDKGPGKKRYRNPKTWKRNIAKADKNSGKMYTNIKGRQVQERVMKPACNEKCRKRCSTFLSEQQRKTIFEKFWLMGDYNRQSSFVGKYVKMIPKKRQIIKSDGQESRRKSNLMYNLPSNDNKTVDVCKSMFRNTLGISDMWITTALKKRDGSEIGEITPDKRGFHENRPNRVPEETRNRIKQHIEMFPTIDSHYCRARTQKQYLEQGLNISKMYRFYVEWLKEKNYEISGTERQYREIFNREYNISFWVPKKDMCDICYAYSIKMEKSEEDETVHIKHLENKEIVRRLKEADKQNTDTKLSTACFDLQKVILIPQKETSQFYYKCKLSVYNFTVFDCSTKEGFYYIWTEQIAKRGANEIASCLLQFIKRMAANGKENVQLYSDNCVGQNKNKFIVFMYLYAVKKYKINIVHRFFEPGHSQNENDSMHALIEKNKLGQDIFTPDQFIMIAKLSKINGKPYVVKEMTQDDFLDFKALEKNYSNFCKDEENNKISWNAIREFQVSCKDVDKVVIRYDLLKESIVTLNLTYPRRNNKRKKVEAFCDEPPRAYKQLLDLPKKKYDHLKILSTKVPSIYKQFYDSLTCASNSQCDSNDESA